MPQQPPERSSQHLLDGSALRALSRRSDLRGAVQCAAHAAWLSATGLLVWLAQPLWYLLIPAMALQGVAIVTLFAPMHECVHRTAFASRAANDAIGWIAGVLGFYNSTDVERDLIRTRTAEGRSRAKARGKHMGRPPSLTPEQKKDAIRRLAQGATLDELARSCNVSRATISRLR